MITAIVYKSNTGFTEKYAMILSEATGLKAISLSEAKKVLQPKEEIIYLGWIFAGMVSGLNKARGKYQVKVIGAVGLSENNKEYQESVKKQNKTNKTPTFFLLGGVDRTKQKGIRKWLFNIVVSLLIKEMNKKPESEITEEKIKQVYHMQHGCDFVSLDQLKDLIQWYENTKE